MESQEVGRMRCESCIYYDAVENCCEVSIIPEDETEECQFYTTGGFKMTLYDIFTVGVGHWTIDEDPSDLADGWVKVQNYRKVPCRSGVYYEPEECFMIRTDNIEVYYILKDCEVIM